MNSDDLDISIKAWRNSNPALDVPVSFGDINNLKSHKNDQFSKQSNVYQFPEESNSIPLKEESFSISVYILLVLTLAVVILFLNYCRKKRRRLTMRLFKS